MASLNSPILFSLLVISSLFLSNANAKPKLGFTADLIPRDSPKSPFYNPALSPTQRVRNAIRRSAERAAQLTSRGLTPNSPVSTITSNRGEYLMNISLGTPPFPIMAIADTGSDLIWTQCEPCDACYRQEAPLFNPERSSTYKDLSCSSRQCQAVNNPSCSRNTCQYSISYGDNSYSKGSVAVDTLTLGSTDRRPVALKNTVIGCSHASAGTFDEKSSGIIGLGGGYESLITQLGDSIDGKFSYCLVPFSSQTDKTSKINFGSNAVVSGSGVVSTPIVPNSPDTFYYLTLEAISVGGKKIEFMSSELGSEEGNIIIDSGTTLTYLPSSYYSEIESAVAAAMDAERVKDPDNFLSLCYKASSDFRVPTMTVHFTNADVELDAFNYFAQISDEAICLALTASDSFSIYGNLAQMNFLVGYDAVSKKVSFKKTDCAKM